MAQLTEGPNQSLPDMLVVDRVERDLRQALAGRGHLVGSKLPQERDLAQQFNVSRRSIREAIARLKRDRLLRAVPGKGTFVVSSAKPRMGVVLFNSDSLHSYNMMCVGVLSEVLRKRGHSPVLVSTSDPLADWDGVMRDHPDACGAVLVGVYPRDLVKKLVRRCDRPMVLVSDMDECFRGMTVCDTVLNDNAAMAYAATAHLIRRGHRRIALVGWDFTRVWSRDMQRGYTEALLANGIEPDPDWQVDLPTARLGQADPVGLAQRNQSVQQRVERWTTSPQQGPTALIHSAGDESRMHDVLDTCFLGKFGDDRVVAVTYREMLTVAYTGMSDATAFCIRFGDVATRAVDLLLRERRRGEAPMREIQGRVFLCQRRNGLWQDQINL